MRVGITGANGFVGKNLKNFLRNRQYHVEEFTDRIKYDSFARFCDSVDFVVNLAGKNKGNAKDIIQSNVFDFKTILDVCYEQSKPLICAGTSYSKNDVYKISKDSAKALCKAYSCLGLDSMTLNIPKLFGSHCRPNYNSFVTTLIYFASRGELNQYKYLVKDLDEELELLYVTDLCESIEDHLNNKFYGYKEYKFTRLDGVFKITFKEILDILNGNKDHKYSSLFLETLEWYKKNEIS